MGLWLRRRLLRRLLRWLLRLRLERLLCSLLFGMLLVMLRPLQQHLRLRHLWLRQLWGVLKLPTGSSRRFTDPRADTRTYAGSVQCARAGAQEYRHFYGRQQFADRPGSGRGQGDNQRSGDEQQG